MPRDTRLWMTFPIDFWQHPKVAPLPVDAKWTFVEMNGYSRMNDLDGRIPAATARHLWKKRALDALVNSDQDRPLVYFSIDPDTYVIRDYAEHQETTTSIEARRATNIANGKKGGRPRKNLTETESVTESVTASGAEQKAESRVQSPEDLTQASSSQSRGERASLPTDAGASEMTRRLASQAGITSLLSVIESARKHAHREIGPDGAFQLGAHLIARARTYPRNPQAYVTRSISLSPFEVQSFIDEQGLAVAS